MGINAIPYISGCQLQRISELPGDLIKTQTAKSPPQSFSFGTIEVKPQNAHFQQAAR